MNRKMRQILFVEDDEALAMGTTYALESEGLTVSRTPDCESARKWWKDHERECDLVLLDVMLPDGDGFSLCEWMKSLREDIPVIFLTALEDEGNVVHGLQFGDDYMTKPFRTKELVARIYANTRKCGKTEHSHAGTQNASGVYRNGELCLNEADMAVFCRGERTPLTLSEYRLFQIFMRNVGQILTREQLMERLWSVDGAFVDDNTLSVYMRRLRQKLEQGTADAYITTVRGVGYRMERKGE
jgi:DNA-binding response OmpR family regulator